jgi:hypothetical protein
MRTLTSDENALVAGGLDTVDVWGRRDGPSDPSFANFSNYLGAFSNIHSALVAAENGRPGDGRQDRQDAVKDEVEDKAAETAEKLEEVVVEAQKCGIPLSTLFNFTSGESGAVWKECFNNLPQKEKENLRDALTVIAAGFALEKSYNPIKIAINALMHDERLMLAELAKALSANDGWHFGENLATLSKGGWDSQIILKLIQSVFRVTARP